MLHVIDLEALGKYAEIKDAIWGSLMKEFGNPANLDDFLAIPMDMLLDGLKAFEYKERADSDPETLSLVQIGRISKWKVAKPDPVSAPSAKSAASDASIKLAHIVNDTPEGYIIRPNNGDMAKLLLQPL